MRTLCILAANALGIACWALCVLSGLFMVAVVLTGANEYGASHFMGSAVLTGFWIAACWVWRPIFNS